MTAISSSVRPMARNELIASRFRWTCGENPERVDLAFFFVLADFFERDFFLLAFFREADFFDELIRMPARALLGRAGPPKRHRERHDDPALPRAIASGQKLLRAMRTSDWFRI